MLDSPPPPPPALELCETRCSLKPQSLPELRKTTQKPNLGRVLSRSASLAVTWDGERQLQSHLLCSTGPTFSASPRDVSPYARCCYAPCFQSSKPTTELSALPSGHRRPPSTLYAPEPEHHSGRLRITTQAFGKSTINISFRQPAALQAILPASSSLAFVHWTRTSAKRSQ